MRTALGCPRPFAIGGKPLERLFRYLEIQNPGGHRGVSGGHHAYAGANGRLTAAPQELLSVAAAPFQKVAAVVSGGVASLWEKYTSIDE